jgi:hypothetical protein
MVPSSGGIMTTRRLRLLGLVVAVVALYDFAFEQGSAWRGRIQGYLAAGLPIVAFLAARAYVLANSAYSPFAFTDNPVAGAGFWTGRLTAVKVIGRYLSLLVWPSKLSSDYSYNEIPLFSWRLSGWEDWKAVIALIVCLAAALAAMRAYRRNKPLFFSITFFFAALAPVSNIPMAIGTIMGERLLYLPSVGFFAAVVCGVLAIWRRVPVREAGYRYGAWAIGGVVLIALTSRTYDRNADWLDQQRFWRSAAEAAPGSYKTQIGTAISAALVTHRDWERSIRHAGRALEILEGVPDLRNAAEAYLMPARFIAPWATGSDSKTGMFRLRPARISGTKSHWMRSCAAKRSRLRWTRCTGAKTRDAGSRDSRSCPPPFTSNWAVRTCGCWRQRKRGTPSSAGACWRRTRTFSRTWQRFTKIWASREKQPPPPWKH